MQNPDDLAKLKANDNSFTKLVLSLEVDKITEVDWYDIRTAIEGNTIVREVHVRVAKDFCETFPLSELLELSKAIGSLSSLKYLLLGQMNGDVLVFGQIPLQAITMMLQHAGDKLLWWMVRGVVVTHVYKGSDEEAEDKSGVLDVSQHRETRISGKEKKKKDKKKKKDDKKDKKKSSKKDKSSSKSSTGMDESSKRSGMDDSSKRATTAPLDTKQAAAKRALEKLADTILCLKNLKRVSLMGHFDDCMYGCQLDPLLEGLGALETLESLMLAVTRHSGRILVDPNALGSFLDGASPQLKEVSILYIELTDDHMDEVASAIAKKENLEELNLSGPGSTSPESIGALFRAPHLKKLTVKELTLDDRCVVAMCIALAHVSNLNHVEVQCGLTSMQLLALQQMIMVNAGIETLYVHLTALEAMSAPLDLITSVFANVKSKLKKVVFEADDKNDECKKFRDIDVKDWEEVLEGFFKVETSDTTETHLLTLTRI